MVLSLLAKPKPNDNTHNTNTDMGLLVVFFPEDNSAIADKSKLFPSPSSSSSSPSSSSRSPASLRRTNSSFLISKAQSTILICALFLFITLLLFTLSTFEPSFPSTPNTLPHPRRFLSQKPQSIHIPNNNPTSNWFLKMWRPNSYKEASRTHFPSTALQRMGTLYRRGTRAMTDLVASHVPEDTTDDELRLFLRLLHRSGLTAKSDVVFVFPSPSSSSKFASIIQQENELFSSLIDHYTELNLTDASEKKNFDSSRFFKVFKKETEMGEPLWGKKSRSNLETAKNNESNSELTQLTYGSVLSFDATELDPENSLAGFLDYVPLRLRRWACYPMLLGRVRRNFKHVMLVDVKDVIVTNDPLARVRNRIPESVLVYTKSEIGSKHGKNSDKTQSVRRVNSGVIMGGARGVRRLANAMLIEIVRAAMQQHKKKNSVSESGVLSQLVSNEFMLKNVKLMVSTESIPESSSLGGHNSLWHYPIIQRGTSNRELNSVIKKQLCSSDVDSSVYRDC